MTFQIPFLCNSNSHIFNIYHSSPLWVHYTPLLPPCDVTYTRLSLYCCLFTVAVLRRCTKEIECTMGAALGFGEKGDSVTFEHCLVLMNRFKERQSFVKHT